MTTAYEEFKQLIAHRKFRQAALFAEERYMAEKSIFWLGQEAYACIREGKYDKAYELNREVLSLEPQNIYALVSCADALHGLGRFPEACDYYKESLKNAKTEARAAKGVCECLLHLKKPDEILEFLSTMQREGVSSGISDDCIQYKIKALKALGKSEEAIQVCRDHLKKKPDEPAVLWELTWLEVEKNGLDAVIEQMGRLVKISTLPPVYKEIYASLCRQAGKDDLALKTYEKMETGSEQFRIQRKKAFTLAKSDKEDEALPLFEELLKCDPKDMYIHSSYVAACARINKAGQGMEFYKSLLLLYPDEKGLYGYMNRLKKKLDGISKNSF